MNLLVLFATALAGVIIEFLASENLTTGQKIGRIIQYLGIGTTFALVIPPGTDDARYFIIAITPVAWRLIGWMVVGPVADMAIARQVVVEEREKRRGRT